LKKREYDKPHDAETIEYIYAKALIEGSIYDKIEALGLSDVVLVNAETGERIDNVEWSYAEYNGKMVVNAVNYDKENAITITNASFSSLL